MNVQKHLKKKTLVPFWQKHLCHFGLISGIHCKINLKEHSKLISTRQDKNSHKDNWLFVHTQIRDKKQYPFPQLSGGITQPHVIQRFIRLI